MNDTIPTLPNGLRWTPGQWTVLSWPRRMDADAWSAQAEPMQAQLMAEVRDEPLVPREPELPDPADKTHLYKPAPPYRVDRG